MTNACPPATSGVPSPNLRGVLAPPDAVRAPHTTVLYLYSGVFTIVWHPQNTRKSVIGRRAARLAPTTAPFQPVARYPASTAQMLIEQHSSCTSSGGPPRERLPTSGCSPKRHSGVQRQRSQQKHLKVTPTSPAVHVLAGSYKASRRRICPPRIPVLRHDQGPSPAEVGGPERHPTIHCSRTFRGAGLRLLVMRSSASHPCLYTLATKSGA